MTRTEPHHNFPISYCLLSGYSIRNRVSVILAAHMTFLDRYRNGERVEVWDDLTSLGAGVRHALYFDDAIAVAAETMRRTRQNIETLIGRLAAVEYRFLDEVSAAEDELAKLEKMAAMEEAMKSRAAAGDGSSSRRVQSVREGAIALAEKTASMREKRTAELAKVAARKRKRPLEDKRVFCPPDKATPKQLAKLEKLAGGPMPISLRAWYEQVGGVSLMGSHPVLNPKEAKESELPDPLVLIPLEEMLMQCEDEEGDGLQIMIAPDALHKADISGDAYYLTLPDNGADFVFDDGSGATFVNYLRKVFAWGGFPGWAQAANPPRELIAQLSDGLVSI